MRREAMIGMAIVLTGVLTGAAAADETYVGTVAIAAAGGASAPVPLTLTIRKYTSDERANQLAQMLHDKGHVATAAELAKDDLGQAQLGDATFRLTLIRQEPTGKGQILRVVTDHPLYAKPPAPAPPAGSVGYLELTVNAEGAGNGRLMPAVTAKFDDEGFVAPENVGGATWTVSDVKRRP
jgi:hypothetical protein